ncbi:unnamed protein product [Cochlearia groenlandica]
MLDNDNKSVSPSSSPTCCPVSLPVSTEPELAKSINSPAKLAGEHTQMVPFKGDVAESSNCNGTANGFGGKQVLSGRSKKGLVLDDHVKDWVKRRVDSGVSESKCVLPFLVGAKKMVDCLVCHKLVYPGEEILCSVRSCQGVYHSICAKKSIGFSKAKKFKCPHHECFVCNRRPEWKCVRCPMATHDKHSPWSEEVTLLKDQPGKAICWRHPVNWRLDNKHAVPQSDIEAIFSQLPLPYVDEEFSLDLTRKDPVPNDEPPRYVHIKRNIYLVKKQRDDANDGEGCKNCGPTCCRSCVCRSQCVSCSEACGCPDTCGNRPFREAKKIKLVKTELCGWGVEAEESINAEEFIVEYIGEVINDAQCEERFWDMKDKGISDFYMCEIQKDLTIDATFKGNISRFLNHSCNPNCILEKWQVEGELRIGIFARRRIEAGEPLTYNYRFVQFGPEVKCHCGSANCQGFLGTKKKESNTFVATWGAKRRRVPHPHKSQQD